MQVSVEVTSDLSRNMKVIVPEEKIQQQVDNRLKSMSQKVKIDGFRPGKVPASVIRKQYGQQVRHEVIGDLIQSSFQEGVRGENLHPAGSPEIREARFDEGEGLEYVAHFEILPEFVIMPLETLEVTEFQSSVEDADVDRMIEQLVDQKKKWETADRESQKGDQVTISFEGTHDGENFTQGRTEDFPVEIGSGQMIPGFEDQLVGHRAGDRFEFDITFPENYQGPKLAGKTAHFEIELIRVAEPVRPAVDEIFVRSFGVESGSLDEFRADIRSNMEREMKRAIRARTKTSVMDQLFERNPIQLPEVLLREELAELIKPYQESARKRKQTLNETEIKEQLSPLARRRVSLGLVLGKVMEAHEVKHQPERVRAAIDELASSYEDPEEVVRWYYADPARTQEIINMTMEDQIVDLVLGKAKKTLESIEFQKLMQAAGNPV